LVTNPVQRAGVQRQTTVPPAETRLSCSWKARAWLIAGSGSTLRREFAEFATVRAPAVQDLCPLSVPPAPSLMPSTRASVSSLVERAFISTTTSVKCMNPEEKLQPYLSLEERPVGTCLPQCRAQFYSDEDRICKGEQRSLLSQADN
ncbi:hypothetical protein L345_15547, partial [Ophiophagus hannah]